jgi:hypothetical protein
LIRIYRFFSWICKFCGNIGRNIAQNLSNSDQTRNRSKNSPLAECGFQEEARKQLDIGWGSAEHPDCRGLAQEEIKRLDFSKLDLAEAFEPPGEVESAKKIKKIEERLKERIQQLL